jgi:hypothetical protein
MKITLGLPKPEPSFDSMIKMRQEDALKWIQVLNYKCEDLSMTIENLEMVRQNIFKAFPVTLPPEVARKLKDNEVLRQSCSKALNFAKVQVTVLERKYIGVF